MKKKNIFLFICTFLFILLVNLNKVSADSFEARFFAGIGGYLKYEGSSIDQGMRKIDTDDENVQLTNHFVRDGYTFYGWVAEYDCGKTWYCDDDANEEASSCSNYKIYSSTTRKKYQTGSNDKKAGYHAVWKNNSTGELEFPEELGKEYDYIDVMYTDETGTENETGKYLGNQSIIPNQSNKLMVIDNSDNYDGWTIGVYKDWNYAINTPDYTKIQWYCADGSLGYNCINKKVFTSVRNIEKGNSVVVIKAHTKTEQKQTYNIMYLSDSVSVMQKQNNLLGEDFIYVEAPYDEDYQLDYDIFGREGKIIGGWYIYIYKYEGMDDEGNLKEKKLCYDPNTDLTTYGPFWVKGEKDYYYYFSEENCDKPKAVRKNYKINIPLDSDFTRYTFIHSWNPSGVGAAKNYTLCVEAKWVDGQGEQSTGYTDDYYCRQQRKVWVQTGDNPSDGYCSINGLTYLKCGDIDDFPAIVPKLSSYAVTLLKTIAPIVLIIISVISLVKSMTAGKEDEIKKAQTTLVKRLIIAAIIFFVVTIVQFIMLKVADGSEQGNLSNCLSCFLNGTGDSNCSNIYYKDSDDGLVVCKWLNNHEAFMCDSGSSVPSNSENNEN